MKKSNFTLWFEQVDPEDVNFVGQKGVRLAEMKNIGLNIPEGFCLTAAAYSHFLQGNNLVLKIRTFLAYLDFRDPRSIHALSQKIKELIKNTEIPSKITKEVIKNYFSLSGLCKEVLVAVRSSPLDEELVVPSFLNIKGEANLIEAIKKCWLSLFDTQNLLKKKNILENQMAVLIQRMLKPQALGTISSQGKKQLMIKSSKKLTTAQTKELKELAKKIRRYFFFPQEIEFALEKNKIYIIKTRPAS